MALMGQSYITPDRSPNSTAFIATRRHNEELFTFLGYNTIILRDAKSGSELPDTWDTLEIIKAPVLDIEINNVFPASSEELVSEIRKCLAKANNWVVHFYQASDELTWI